MNFVTYISGTGASEDAADGAENEGEAVEAAGEEDAIAEESEEEDDDANSTLNMSLSTLSPSTSRLHRIKAIAIFPWYARKENQLSFPKGAVITVRKQSDSWWAGELDGRVGWFPKSYVKVFRGQKRESVAEEAASMASTPQEKAKYRAVYAYEAVEKSELSFQAGDIIEVSSQSGSWWEGECKGRKGQFPASYVKPV